MITKEIFTSFLYCEFKTWLLLTGFKGQKALYEKYFKELLKGIDKNYKKQNNVIKKHYNNEQHKYNIQELQCGRVFDMHISTINFKVNMYISNNFKKNSKYNYNETIPVLIIPDSKIKSEHKLVITFLGIVLSEIIEKLIEYGQIIYGAKQKKTTIRFKRLLEKGLLARDRG